MQKGFSSFQSIVGIFIVALLIAGAYYLGKNSSILSPIDNAKIEPAQLIPQKNGSLVITPASKFTYIKDGDVYILDLNNSQTKKLTNYGYNTSPILSPDNSKIAYLSVPEAVVKSGKVQKFPGSGAFDHPISREREYNVWIINTDGTNPIQVTEDSKQRNSLSWSADSKKLAFLENNHLYKYSLESKEKEYIDGNGVTSPIFGPKTDALAYVLNNEKNIVFTSKIEGFSFENTPNTPQITGLNWSSDEKNLFFTAVSRTEGFTYKWKFSTWVFPIDGKAFQITKEEDRIHTPFISPNEDYLAAYQGSGFADAGNIDLTLIVLKLNKDLTISKQIKLEDFEGPDYFEKEKQFMFPVGKIVWLTDKELVVQLDALVNPQPNPRGIYKLNVENLSAERLLEL